MERRGTAGGKGGDGREEGRLRRAVTHFAAIAALLSRQKPLLHSPSPHLGAAKAKAGAKRPAAGNVLEMMMGKAAKKE